MIMGLEEPRPQPAAALVTAMIIGGHCSAGGDDDHGRWMGPSMTGAVAPDG